MTTANDQTFPATTLLPCQGVLFDCDGVLVDSEAIILASWPPGRAGHARSASAPRRCSPPCTADAHKTPWPSSSAPKTATGHSP